MMKTASLSLVVLFVLSALLVASSGSAAASYPGCTHTYSAPLAQQWTINSPGIYCLKAGTYDTQITITSSNVVLTSAPGTDPGQVIIEPSSVVVNNYLGAFGGLPQAAIVLAVSSGSGSNLASVSVTNLVIDGAAASSSMDNFALCSTDYAGINFNGAAGSISNNIVKNIYMPPDQAGCFDGGGINGDTNNIAPTEAITIANNVVPNYNEYGIACFGAGVECNVRENTVSFYAKYSTLAPVFPAGIAILYGAVGKVFYNIASGNECNLPPICGPNYISQYLGQGILTEESGAGTVVSGNTVYGNDIGIWNYDDSASSTNNLVLNNRGEGMVLTDGTYTPFDNLISGSQIGIAVSSDGLADIPTEAGLMFNHFIGNFPQALVQVVAYSAPYAYSYGPYAEPVTVRIDGFSVTVSPGASGIPTYVNLTSLPDPWNCPVGVLAQEKMGVQLLEVCSNTLQLPLRA